MISTINFHLTRNCNYQCKYCFAHFCDTHNQLSFESRKKLVATLCEPEWVDKINFVGGEPTLIGDQLTDLMKVAKSEKNHPVKVSVTTNSSLISAEWIDNALQQIHFDDGKFNQRGGSYTIPELSSKSIDY